MIVEQPVTSSPQSSLLDNEGVNQAPSPHPADTPGLRKARGAFFTPQQITRFIAEWAIDSADNRVLEPSAGDAAFLVDAVARLKALSDTDGFVPTVNGVEIHDHSAEVGRQRVADAGGLAQIQVSDFFLVDSEPKYDAVIGNPPFIRYQEFVGESRMRSRASALSAGVALTGLASSWAAFAVHSASFLRDGGKLGLVLPAELLSVNYAGPVRRFLFERFRSIQIVLFDEQVFPDAEADVVVLLADGFNEGPAASAVIRQARNADYLSSLESGQSWTPIDPSAKWTSSLVGPLAVEPLRTLQNQGSFVSLEDWGDTTLGTVTGNNSFFALSPRRVRELGLHRSELVRISPPGSAHLRGLVLSSAMLTRLGKDDKATYLFAPKEDLSPEAAAYIEAGHLAGVDTAYKCRVRRTWYRVPLMAPADLFLTSMNADTPRLTTNVAGVRHLNSVHGVYLKETLREIGRQWLPLASLNSLTVLSAEMSGRSYGGGILKLEPKEADGWAMPSPTLVAERLPALAHVRTKVMRLLQAGDLSSAVALVDGALLLDSSKVTPAQIAFVRRAHEEFVERRTVRGASGRGALG